MRRLLAILAMVSLLFALLGIVASLRSRHRIDAITFVFGHHFFFLVTSSDGLSLQWLADVSDEDKPDPKYLGWISFPPAATARWGRPPAPSTGPFINIPDATRAYRTIAGLHLTWGQGQILRKTFIVYVKTPLLPFSGISAFWSTILLYSALFPSLWLLRRIYSFLHRRDRRLNGLCPTCGYDLRAQLALSERSESNGPPRCPECGTPIPSIATDTKITIK